MTQRLDYTDKPLDADATYTGEWRYMDGFDAVSAAVYTDAACTFYYDFSSDRVNVDSSLTYDVAAGINEVHRLTVTRKWCRMRIVNSSTSMTELRAELRGGSFPQLAAPLNLTLGQDADAIAVRAIPSEIDLAQGRLGGISKANKLGKNSDIDTGTTPEWVTEGGGVYTGFPVDPTAETIEIFSSSVNDTSAGSGARTVRIIGLDENWEIQSETVTLNGTTGVTTTGTYVRAHTMFVTSAGDETPASGINEGTITARMSTTTSVVFLTILPGVGSSNYAVYTVPAGKSGIILAYTAEIRRGGTAAVDGVFWIRTFNGAPRYRRPWAASTGANARYKPYGGNRFGEKTDIGMVITNVTANNTSIAAGFDIILIDN